MRKRERTWGRAVGAVGIGLGAAALGAAGVVAGGAALARRVVTPEAAGAIPVTVDRVVRDDERIVVWLNGPQAGLPGQYSLQCADGTGHARLGPVLAGGPTRAAREVIQLDRGTIEPGLRGRLSGWWYPDPEALGLRTERIRYETELGEADAWILHPPRSRAPWRRRGRGRWAVHVHGRGALPEETLRGVLPLAKAGITSLVISYRNDPGAPAGEHGRYGMGQSESRDVDAAIAETLRRGAERVTLFGWSMGGTAVLHAATEGRYAALVDGVILDSPAVDWPELLRAQAARVAAPRALADLGMGLLERGLVRGGELAGIDFSRATPAHFAPLLRVPVLVHASRGDTFVPSAGAEALAAARGDLVQLRLLSEGEHVRLWNVNPEAWAHATEEFARALPRPAWRGDPPAVPGGLD